MAAWKKLALIYAGSLGAQYLVESYDIRSEQAFQKKFGRPSGAGTFTPLHDVARAAVRAAVSKLTPVTQKMRDNVRRWAAERVATQAARAQGAIDTEGIAVAAARAALTGQVMGPTPRSAGRWDSIPNDSIIGFGKGKNARAFSGGDVKSLVREAIAAGKNHVANAPQLEAFTGPRYADKARAAAAGARVAKKAPSRRALKTARERVGRPKKA